MIDHGGIPPHPAGLSAKPLACSGQLCSLPRLPDLEPAVSWMCLIRLIVPWLLVNRGGTPLFHFDLVSVLALSVTS